MEQGAWVKIVKECRQRRVLSPFAMLPMPNLRVYPLGVVPKKVPGELCLICHLSYARGQWVNNTIPDYLCLVCYTSFDQEVPITVLLWEGTKLAECDIKIAFHILLVHPNDLALLGFAFDRDFFMDRALPMASSLSRAAFEQFSSFLE